MAFDFFPSLSETGEATWKPRPLTTPSPVVRTRASAVRRTCEVYGSQIAQASTFPG